MNKVLIVLGSLAIANSAHAIPYSYVTIAAPGVFPGGVYQGTVNNSGEVAFAGFGPFVPGQGKVETVFKGSGGSLTTIASTVASQFTFFNPPFINGPGDVAFRGLAGFTAPNGAYRGNGGALTTIYTAPNGVDPYAINDSGTVVFSDNAIGIMTGNGGTPTIEVPLGGPFAGFGFADINNAGTIAFPVTLTTGQSAIYTKNANTLTQIAISGGSVSDITGAPKINQSGDLAWFANLDTGDQEIQTKIGGIAGVFVDTKGPYAQFGFHNALDINIFNEIVFSAVLDSNVDPSASGLIGIFTGPNPVTDSVIRSGDLLAGKTVREAYLGGINDCGQISFGAIFSDFTYGMFRADPSGRVCNTVPEPNSLMLLSLGSLVLLGQIGRTKLKQGRRKR